MSATALSTVQSLIERSLFEALRSELIDKLYLPDVADTTAYPNNQVGFDAWKAAVSAVVTAKGFAIEIFSEGSNQAKGVKKVPRIVMNVGSFLPGALGGDPQRYFFNNGTSYKALVTPPQTVDFYVNFHLVSNTVEQERILNSILALAVPRRGYIPWYSDETKTFFARYLNYFDGDNLGEGLIEKVYAYEIPDCWDMEDREVEAIVAKMTEITLNTNVQKYMDGSWGYDSDPLVIN